jgi:hypothetical protein
MQGILGIDSDVRNGFGGIKVTYRIDADAKREDIEALVAAGSTPCTAATRNWSSSHKFRTPNLAPQMRMAFSQNGRKDRLKAPLQTGDDLEHLSGCCLLQRAFVEFMERGPVRPSPHITFGRAPAIQSGRRCVPEAR